MPVRGFTRWRTTGTTTRKISWKRRQSPVCPRRRVTNVPGSGTNASICPYCSWRPCCYPTSAGDVGCGERGRFYRIALRGGASTSMVPSIWNGWSRWSASTTPSTPTRRLRCSNNWKRFTSLRFAFTSFVTMHLTIVPKPFKRT